MLILLLACAVRAPIENAADDHSALLFLNEVLADRSAGGDWIELYAAGNADVDVSGYRLADEDGDEATIPPGTVVPAGGWLVIGCDTEIEASEVNVGLSLDKDGDGVTLAYPDDAVVDAISWSSLTGAVAAARMPDGHDDWYYDHTPTPGAPNE
jgi:hypothetical protein